MYPFEFDYLWTMSSFDGPRPASEIAAHYGSINDWRRGDGRAAGNTLKALRRRGLVNYDADTREWSLTTLGRWVREA